MVEADGFLKPGAAQAPLVPKNWRPRFLIPWLGGKCVLAKFGAQPMLQPHDSRDSLAGRDGSTRLAAGSASSLGMDYTGLEMAFQCFCSFS